MYFRLCGVVVHSNRQCTPGEGQDITNSAIITLKSPAREPAIY